MTDLQFFQSPDENTRRELDALLEASGLRRERAPDETAALWRGGVLAATGSRCGDVLQYIAVRPEFEGEGLCEAVVSALTERAMARGIFRLFLFTKPQSAAQFIAQGYTPLVETARMVMLENSSAAFPRWLASLPRGADGRAGAIVANLNPLTRGHLRLIEHASRACDTAHLFVLSEEASLFAASERLAMAREAAKRFPNVLVHPGGRYVISAATYPAYFLRDASDAAEAQRELDAALFAARIAPALGITTRFVGSEPFSPSTARYNETLARVLPRHGVALDILERSDGVSASAVRAAMAAGDAAGAEALVPPETLPYIRRRMAADTEETER